MMHHRFQNIQLNDDYSLVFLAVFFVFLRRQKYHIIFIFTNVSLLKQFGLRTSAITPLQGSWNFEDQLTIDDKINFKFLF